MSDEIQSLQAVLSAAVESGLLTDAVLQHIESPVWSPLPSQADAGVRFAWKPWRGGIAIPAYSYDKDTASVTKDSKSVQCSRAADTAVDAILDSILDAQQYLLGARFPEPEEESEEEQTTEPELYATLEAQSKGLRALMVQIKGLKGTKS